MNHLVCFGFATLWLLACDGRVLEVGAQPDGAPGSGTDGGGGKGGGLETGVSGDASIPPADATVIADSAHPSSDDVGAHPADSATLGATTLAALTPGGDDDAGSCVDSCSAAPAMQPIASAEDAQSDLLGKWIACADPGHLGGPANAVGIEFATGGLAYFLVAGPGGPVRATGFQFQLTYGVLAGCSAAGCEMFLAQGSGGADYGFVYSPCPRQLWME